MCPIQGFLFVAPVQRSLRRMLVFLVSYLPKIGKHAYVSLNSSIAIMFLVLAQIKDLIVQIRQPKL